MKKGVKNIVITLGNRGIYFANKNEEYFIDALKLKNEVLSEDIAAVFFTTTAEISDEFPAVAAREMGWDTVPLICGHEMAVPHGLEKCIRILILWNTETKQKEIRHPYLRKAISLRKSGNDFEAT